MKPRHFLMLALTLLLALIVVAFTSLFLLRSEPADPCLTESDLAEYVADYGLLYLDPPPVRLAEECPTCRWFRRNADVGPHVQVDWYGFKEENGRFCESVIVNTNIDK